VRFRTTTSVEEMPERYKAGGKADVTGKPQKLLGGSHLLCSLQASKVKASLAIVCNMRTVTFSTKYLDAPLCFSYAVSLAGMAPPLLRHSILLQPASHW